jgi:hypothetical protein
MAKAATIKIKTNIPLTGTVSAIYHQPSTREDWSDQICLYGDWSEGKGKVYLADWAAEKLSELGVINGGPSPAPESRYSVNVGKSITILRSEDGNKKHTEITVGSNGAAPQPTASAPESPQKAQNVRSEWKVLQDRFMAAYLIARKVLPEDTPPEVVQSATACVFIEANKQGLMPPEIKRPDVEENEPQADADPTLELAK